VVVEIGIAFVERPGSAQVIGRRQLENAIRRNEIMVLYQPVIDLLSRRCVGAEALVRWRRADGEIIMPDRFIPAAERLRCTDLITDRVVELVVGELGTCLFRYPALHVAINVSPAEVGSGGILPLIEDRLRGSGIRPAQIWLEITEGQQMEIASARATLSRARGRGHVVAIDDFGVGYSSLRYLHELSCDVLKIDRSFICGISGEGAPHPVLGCIIDIATTLGMKLVAEGVETAAQASYLAEAGVHFAQGWYFSRPRSGEDFIDYLDVNDVAAP